MGDSERAVEHTANDRSSIERLAHQYSNGKRATDKQTGSCINHLESYSTKKGLNKIESHRSYYSLPAQSQPQREHDLS